MPDVKLRFPEAALLFVLGGVAALIGDHSHVVTATTEYYTDAVPFIWSSPFWFPVPRRSGDRVAGRASAAPARAAHAVTVRQGVAGVAVVVGMYVTTALVHAAPIVPATALICVAAVVTWCVLGDGPGAICGAVAAIVGPVVEIGLVATGRLRLPPTAPMDCSASVPGSVPLYFAFGVVVALLGELLAGGRRGVQTEMTSAVSGPGAG